MIFEVKVIYEAPDYTAGENIGKWINGVMADWIKTIGPVAIPKPLVGEPVRLDISGR